MAMLLMYNEKEQMSNIETKLMQGEFMKDRCKRKLFAG